MVIIRQTLHLTRDGSRLVEANDPDAGDLWCVPGDAVNQDDLRRLGWTPPERKAVEAAPENKAVEMPAPKPKPKPTRARSGKK